MRQLSTDLRRPDSYTNPTTSNGNGTPCRRRRYKRPHLPPLFYAVQARNWDTALRRSQTHPHEIVTVEDSSGDNPLHYACRLNRTQDVVRALLAASRDVNHEGATPLHVAASHRCSAQVIRILVQLQMPSSTISVKGSTNTKSTRTTHKKPNRYLAIITGVDAILQENNTSIYNEKMCKKIICWMGRNL